MEKSFKEYLKEARKEFATVAAKYSANEHLELRTAIDSFLIAYDQAVAQASLVAQDTKSEIPKEIYLNIGLDENVLSLVQAQISFKELVGVTWSKDKISDQDIKYILANNEI